MDGTGTNSQRTLDSLVVLSSAMHHAVAAAKRAARGDDPVFVDGAAGTGRKLMARVIHEESARGNQPLAIVYCEKLTMDVLDRVLLGDRGSGAPGKLDEAAAGSLLLADIEDLSPVAQERLLTIFEHGHYTNARGETREFSSRLISTGDAKEIVRRVKLAQFSEQLFKLLRTAQVHLPTLAERREDIPHLVIEVLRELSVRERIESPMVPYHYMELLTNVAWPENVRQLRNHVESVMVLSGGVFDPQIIQEHFVAEESNATIMGAVQVLWNKLRGVNTSAALNGSRA